MNGLKFDEPTARELEVLYGRRDVLRRRQLVREALGGSPGERIMDVGCGPGFYVAELLDQVGSDGFVVGIDNSQPMLALAAHRSAGHDNVAAGGRLVLWDVDWATLSLYTTDSARTERILRAWDGHLAHRSLPQTLTAQLHAVGFDDVKVEGHTFATNRFDQETYGGFLVPFIARFVVGRDGISDDEAAAWEAEQRDLGRSGEFFFACIQFCFTATRSG